MSNNQLKPMIRELGWIVPGPVETPAELDAPHLSVDDEAFKGYL